MGAKRAELRAGIDQETALAGLCLGDICNGPNTHENTVERPDEPTDFNRMLSPARGKHRRVRLAGDRQVRNHDLCMGASTVGRSDGPSVGHEAVTARNRSTASSTRTSRSE